MKKYFFHPFGQKQVDNYQDRLFNPKYAQIFQAWSCQSPKTWKIFISEEIFTPIALHLIYLHVSGQKLVGTYWYQNIGT
jgi:hypothetical protein